MKIKNILVGVLVVCFCFAVCGCSANSRTAGDIAGCLTDSECEGIIL